MPLMLIEAGKKARVVSIMGTEETRKRLGALGFVPGAVVAVVQSEKGNMIVGIHESRIALNADLAKRLMVEPL